MTMRFGFNVNGQRLGDAAYFYDFVRQLRPTWMLIMDSPKVANNVHDITEGETNVVQRTYSEKNGSQWQRQSPESYATELMAQGNKHLWKYILNEPGGGTNEKDVRRMSEWIARVVEIMTDNGHKVVAANLSVATWENWMVNKGGYDRLLHVLSERREVAKFGIHEYTAIVLPFGVGAWDRWDMLDREKMQPHQWPRLDTRLGTGQRLGDYTKEVVPVTYHLLRSHWFQRRVVDVLKKDPLDFVLTEYGWDRLGDLTAGQNHIYDALLKRYGASHGYHELHSAYTLANVWKHYWPEWSTSRAVFEQFKWSDSVYSSDYLAFLPFMWSFGDEWDASGFNFGADKELHSLMLEWAESLRDESQDVPSPEPQPDPDPIEPDPDEVIMDDFSNILRNSSLNGFRQQEVVYEENGRKRVIEAPDNWTWVYEPKQPDPGQVPEVFHRSPGMGVAGGYIAWLGGFEQDDVKLVKGQRYLARATTQQNFRFASEGNFEDNINWRFVVTDEDGVEYTSDWLRYGGDNWQNNQIEMLWVFEPVETFTGSFRYECRCKWANTDGEMLWVNIACQNAPEGYKNDVVQFIGEGTPDPDPTPDPDLEIDTLDYVRGDGRVYDLEFQFPGNQYASGAERMQTQVEGRRFFHVKGGVDAVDYNWEELWYTNEYVYRGTDISPSEAEYYETSENGKYGQRWLPRRARVGDRILAVPLITFRYKSNGQNVPSKAPYLFPHWIEIKAIHASYTFPDSGQTVNDVVELWSYLHDPQNNQPGENFERSFYAKGYGLVGWQDPTKNWRSYMKNPQVTGQTTLPRKVVPSIQLPPLPPLDETPDPTPDPTPNPDTFPLSDPRWSPVWASSVGGFGTNIRQRPTTSSPRVGLIRQDYPALLLKQEKRTMNDGVWYPIRLNTQVELNHSNGDFSNFGWVRSDVFTYRDYVAPSPDPKPEPNDEAWFELYVTYNKANATQGNLADAVRNISEALNANGADVLWDESDTQE